MILGLISLDKGTLDFLYFLVSIIGIIVMLKIVFKIVCVLIASAWKLIGYVIDHIIVASIMAMGRYTLKAINCIVNEIVKLIFKALRFIGNLIIQGFAALMPNLMAKFGVIRHA